MSSNMTCPNCEHDHYVKNGHKGGKQNYLCRGCKSQWTTDRAELLLEKRCAVTLYCMGLSLRKVSKLLCYSHVTILNWVREFMEKSDGDTSYDVIMELDEIKELLDCRNASLKLKTKFKNVYEAMLDAAELEVSRIMTQELTGLSL